jgi:hypothetical protein
MLRCSSFARPSLDGSASIRALPGTVLRLRYKKKPGQYAAGLQKVKLAESFFRMHLILFEQEQLIRLDRKV